mmetsp:Transcript_18332/g.25354  ORF Transcript_18332/g.25354 Transcript_18332/m.25354 type:complete len:215 (-) Transcript_18332:132-776(-)
MLVRVIKVQPICFLHLEGENLFHQADRDLLRQSNVQAGLSVSINEVTLSYLPQLGPLRNHDLCPFVNEVQKSENYAFILKKKALPFQKISKAQCQHLILQHPSEGALHLVLPHHQMPLCEHLDLVSRSHLLICVFIMSVFTHDLPQRRKRVKNLLQLCLSVMLSLNILLMNLRCAFLNLMSRETSLFPRQMKLLYSSQTFHLRNQGWRSMRIST